MQRRLPRARLFSVTPATIVVAVAALIGSGLLPSPASAAHPRALVSPVSLGWTTFLGGSANTGANAVTADSHGAVYVTGDTDSSDFPVTPGVAQGTTPGAVHTQAAFVASFTAAGGMRWATYLGGAGASVGEGIAVDPLGDVYVIGITTGGDFPVTLRNTGMPPASTDTSVFIASYTARGFLRWATIALSAASFAHTGRVSSIYPTGIVADAKGNVDVTGTVFEVDPAHPPASVGRGHAFVLSLSRAGSPRWTTFLTGATGDDEGHGITVDAAGAVYITGSTGAAGLPVTAGAAQMQDANTSGSGVATAFVAAYTAAGTLRWATYLGGSGDADGNGIATAGGLIYVTGETDSADFPVTSTAYHQLNLGTGNAPNAFLAVFTAQGTLRRDTYFGGTPAPPPGVGDFGTAVVVDTRGFVTVTGIASSVDFPRTDRTIPPPYAGDSAAFVAQFSPDGALRSAAFLAGSESGGLASSWALGVDPSGAILLAGAVNSSSVPTTPGAYDSVKPCADYQYAALISRKVFADTRPSALAPADPPPAGTAHMRYFAATHHALQGDFLAAWDRLGGTPTLGLPVSQPFTLLGVQAQVTERAVLVLGATRVTLLPLGVLLTQAKAFRAVPPVVDTAGERYFPATGHTLSSAFLRYWLAHDGSAVLGPPISEPEEEMTGDSTGGPYTVQWFVNGRLEWHLAPVAQIEAGRVGVEFLQRLGLL